MGLFEYAREGAIPRFKQAQHAAQSLSPADPEKGLAVKEGAECDPVGLALSLSSAQMLARNLAASDDMSELVSYRCYENGCSINQRHQVFRKVSRQGESPCMLVREQVGQSDTSHSLSD
jgi:hypothetical protein